MENKTFAEYILSEKDWIKKMEIMYYLNKRIMDTSKKVMPYVRVLGFNQNGKKLLSEIAMRNPKINMVTSVKKYINQNRNKQLAEMLDIDILATNVYTLGYEYESKANLDFTNNMIITN